MKKMGSWKKLPGVKQFRGWIAADKRSSRASHQVVSYCVPMENVIRFKELKKVQTRDARIEVETMLVRSTLSLMRERHTNELANKIATLLIDKRIRLELQGKSRGNLEDTQHQRNQQQLHEIFNEDKRKVRDFFETKSLIFQEYEEKASKLKSTQQ
ncbi:MAG: hypothetical protein HON47_04835 [Candidatus Diapherotrites archaeon]|jgi:hypothetical protein|uniref:Uncharacterized protein n=1 Tax=Candidatus Iainarchaeum sp. TaxID=3101447 RepID=A0A8T5GFV9_9ARCH|nr:hypothetical protein [Candidatus Diapherotrites archaeon]MBT7241277.1 hypothetical protein [Candidatus Diapherotrites archaeon]